MNELLKKACFELAKESFEWIQLRKASPDLTGEELQRLTSKGAWEKYLKAGGSRTMINEQLTIDEDFGGQYKTICNENGFEI